MACITVSQSSFPDDQKRLQSLYYQSMLTNHKVSLFTRTHQRMLRALYINAPGSQDYVEMEKLWGLVEQFLNDQGTLMTQRFRLLQAKAAEPWLARTVCKSNQIGAGWRITRRFVADTLRYEEHLYQNTCQRHYLLLEAIDREINKILTCNTTTTTIASSSPSSSSELSPAFHSSSSSSTLMPPVTSTTPTTTLAAPNPSSLPVVSLEALPYGVNDCSGLQEEMRRYDEATMVEQKLLLWSSLKSVVWGLCS